MERNLSRLFKVLASLFFASAALAQTPTPTPTPTCAPPAFVQSMNYHGPLAPGNFANRFGSNLTAGRTIVCGIHVENGTSTVTSVTNTSGDTFTDVSSRCLADGNNRSVSIWRAANIAGGNFGDILVNLSSGGNHDITCHEYSGLTTSPNDGSSCGTWGDDPTSGSIVTTQNADLLFGYVVNNGGNAGLPSGYTSRVIDVNNLYYRTADKIAGAAGSYAAQWTTSGTASGVSYMAAFKSVCTVPVPTATPTPTATPVPVVPAHVQSKEAYTNSPTSAIWTSNTTTGNAILVGILIENSTATITGVTDSQGNTYTAITARSSEDAGNYMQIWGAFNITGGTTPTVTVTASSAIQLDVGVSEYSGVATASAVDAFSNGAIHATAPTASVTTTQSGDLLFGSIVSDPGYGGLSGTVSYTSRNRHGYNKYFQTLDGLAGPAGVHTINMDTGPGRIQFVALKNGSVVVTPTPTATPTNTPTPVPTNTPTPIPTATPFPTATPVNTPTPAPTFTPVPTATPKPTIAPNPTLPPGYTPGPLVRYTPNSPFEPCNSICCIRSTCPAECGATYCEDLGLGRLVDPKVKECINEKLEEAGC